MGGDNSGNTAYSPKLLVDTVETPTTRIRRSIRGSFNNDDNRIFDFKDKKSSDYFVRNDSFDRILQQFVQVYQNSLLSSNESLKTANYHIVNDNDDDIYSENVDDNEDSDETSGDKPTSAYENNDTYIFALQQLSNYITMQIKSSIKKKYYDNNRDVETISSSSIDLSVSPQDSSPLISSSSSSSSLPLSSSSSSSFSSGDSVLPPSSPSFPTSSSSSSSQSSSSSSSQHLPLDSKNTDSSDFNLPDVSIHPSRYMSQGAASAHESDPTAGKKTNYGEEDMRKELHHSYEMEIAHKLHFASLCVVSILFIEVAMKIFCAGSHFLKRKIEVFDAVVIVTSVVVDLIFIKGLSEFAVDDSIFVLAFLLPWRVIRVVNSLVMAAIDHEHVKLRLLYSRKKKLDKTVENLRNEVDELKGLLQDIRQFCIKEGIEAATMDELLGKFAPRRRKDSKFYTLVKLVMSTASINNNNDNVSISSSSMENDLRDYACRDSIINETTSNENTFTSLRQYLSVPFRNDSQSTSDVESNDEGSPMSPCIYVTSPGSDDEGGGRAGEGMDGDDDNLDDCAFSFDTDEAMRRRERELMMKCSTSQDSHPRRHIRTVFDFDNKNKPAALSGTSKTCKIHKHDRDLCETSFICNEESCNAEGSIKEETIGAEGGTSPPLTHVDSFSFHQLDESPNQNAPATYRNRRFLSVPPLSVPRFHPMHQPTNSPTVLLSNASNNNNNIDVGDNSPLDFSSNLNQSLPPNTAFEMKRSASENVNALTLTTNYFNTNNNNNDNSYINNSPPENLDNVYFYRYDSPILHRKSVSSTPPSPLQSKRSSPWKISSRRNSATTERETQSLLKRSSSRRVRHFSGGDCMEAQSLSQHRRCQSERSRSHSPSPMNLLAVPGGKRSHGRREDKTSQFESKSMQDVSMAGNSHANNLSSDGKLLRSSCLSLNGERRKRRGKSPHRVSFKVS